MCFMLRCVSDRSLAVRLDRAESHLYRVEGLLRAMRLAATSQLIDEETASPFSMLIEVIEDDCERLRETLFGKEKE